MFYKNLDISYIKKFITRKEKKIQGEEGETGKWINNKIKKF